MEPDLVKLIRDRLGYQIDFLSDLVEQHQAFSKTISSRFPVVYRVRQLLIEHQQQLDILWSLIDDEYQKRRPVDQTVGD